MTEQLQNARHWGGIIIQTQISEADQSNVVRHLPKIDLDPRGSMQRDGAGGAPAEGVASWRVEPSTVLQPRRGPAVR
jgi:hypothetical protein